MCISILPWAVFELIVLTHSQCVYDSNMCGRERTVARWIFSTVHAAAAIIRHLVSS